MADDGDSLLREVDEELRREKMERFWQRYNGLILGAAAVVIAGVAGYKFLENRRLSATYTAGSQFNAAVELANQNKREEAIKAFQNIAETGPHGYASLAKLHIAGAYVKDGKTAEAVAAFDALASDPSVDQLLKSFAQLQAASLRMDQADFTEMQNRLNSLTGDSSPYKVSARELLGFAAFKAGKLEEARKLLEPLLIDPNATRAIQDRIKVVMAEITAAELAKEPASGAAPQATEPAKPDAAASPASAQTAPADKPETEPAATQTVPPAAAAGEDAGKAGDSKTEADKAGADKTGAGGTEEKAAPATPAQ
ncbi:MAG: tetratricopeptide repeat protein [Hyphomicrobium sp.]|nr:tetratricopeptide repeat protein [Hyphomicrobium sp.]